MFEVKLVRSDTVPVEEVMRRPTATEVDDYLEYKRLRRVHRDEKRKGPIVVAIKKDHQHTTKAATQFPPLQPIMPPSAAQNVLRRGSPSPLLSLKFKRRQFGEHSHVHFSGQDTVSPMTVARAGQLGLATVESNEIAEHTEPHARRPHTGNESSRGNSNVHGSGAISNNSIAHIAASAQANIREVAPWIDFDAGLTLSSLDNPSSITRDDTTSPVPKPSTEIKKASTKITQRRGAERLGSQRGRRRRRRKSDAMEDTTTSLSPPSWTKKDTRKSIFQRSRNPMAKLFDGVDDDANPSLSNTLLNRKPAALRIDPTASEPLRREDMASPYGTLRVHSPIPIRPLGLESPLSTFGMVRRDAICPTDDLESLFPGLPGVKSDSVDVVLFPRDEEEHFADTQISPQLQNSLPGLLKSLVIRPVAAVYVPGATSTPTLACSEERQSVSVGVLPAAKALQKMMQEFQTVDIKVAFKDPFCDTPYIRQPLERESSSLGVAPDVVA